MDKFLSFSWTLGLQISISGSATQDSSASFTLWHSSLPWLGQLYSQLISPPKSRAAVMKMTRSKVGMPRKKKVRPLGEMLKTLDLQFNLGQATVRFWNVENVCLEAAMAAAGLRLQTVLDDLQRSPRTKVTGVHMAANNVVARFLINQDEAATLQLGGNWVHVGAQLSATT